MRFAPGLPPGCNPVLPLGHLQGVSFLVTLFGPLGVQSGRMYTGEQSCQLMYSPRTRRSKSASPPSWYPCPSIRKKYHFHMQNASFTYRKRAICKMRSLHTDNAPFSSHLSYGTATNGRAFSVWTCSIRPLNPQKCGNRQVSGASVVRV